MSHSRPGRSSPHASRPRWWLLAVGVPLVVAGGTVLGGSAWAVRGSHPAYGITVIAACFVGLLVIASALRHRNGAANGRRVLPALARLTTVLASLLLAAALVWLRPFPAEPEVDLASVGQDVSVDITTSYNRIDLAPVARRATGGMVFYPGARVDPRAYVPLLTPVAAAGYRVVIVKPPFNLAVVSAGAADRIVKDWAEVEHWVIAGHSLGGVVAARYAGRERAKVEGLVLWASYPARNLADASIDATSIYGTNDALTTPADIDASRALLPKDTRFVRIEGGVHAFFGDYGVQPGDGRPGVPRAQAQQIIIAETIAALARVNAAGGGP